MTIKETINKILNSTEFNKALEEGDLKTVEIILIDLCHLVYDHTKNKCVRTYGVNKYSNTMMIKAQLKATGPPTDLNFNIK